MERGNLERELIQWMGRGAGIDGRKERGWEEGRREEGDRPGERKEECEQEFISFFHFDTTSWHDEGKMPGL